MNQNTQLLLSLIISILMGWWASSIAEKGGKKPRKWFFLGFFFGIFAVLYLLVSFFYRKQKPVKVTFAPVVPVLSYTEPFMKQWFYLDEMHTQQGPVGFHYLKGKVKENLIHPVTYVWAEGMEEWKRIQEIPGLLSAIQEK